MSNSMSGRDEAITYGGSFIAEFQPHSLQVVNVPSTKPTNNSLSKDFCAYFPRIS